MANESATVQKSETFSGGELGALLELMFSNLNVNLEPFDTFQAQLDLSEFVGQTIDFHRAITAVKELYRTKPHLVDGLHASVHSILRELTATGLWKADKVVNPAHVRALCDTHV